MRILIDYRPALRERTGVGEYVHQLAAALARQGIDDNPAAPGADGRRAPVRADEVEVFTSSWKDRPSAAAMAELGPVRVVDRRIPVRLLNLLWHRLEAPPVEWLVGRSFDVVHSPYALLLPSRRAAQVITIQDLDFLQHPERTAAEVRRDYGRLAAAHARRADAIIVSSRYVAQLVESAFGVDRAVLSVCPFGAPKWAGADAIVPGNPRGEYVLFLGTLEPRKNVGGLLQAYGRLIADRPDAPRLVVAGRTTAASAPWLEAMTRSPLAGRVDYRGYVPAIERERLLRGARILVLPSFDEGFGLPLLEAMSLGIPVVAADRGALPEVAGGAAVLVNPDEAGAICRGMQDVLDDPDAARERAERGLARAATFTWERAAALTREAYVRAITNRRQKAEQQ